MEILIIAGIIVLGCIFGEAVSKGNQAIAEIKSAQGPHDPLIGQSAQNMGSSIGWYLFGIGICLIVILAL